MVKIAFLGDLALVGKFDYNSCNNVDDNISFLKKSLESFDYRVANLESPLTYEKNSFVCKSVHLKSDPINVEILKKLNINAVSLANNHIFDYGSKGLSDTIKILEENNIEWFGVNNKKCKVIINDERLSFSGFCCYSTNGYGYDEDNTSKGVNLLTFDNVLNSIEDDIYNNYFPILSFHWGIEHTNCPPIEYVNFVNFLSSKYSFIIHGHHPHQVQGIVKKCNSLVAYSLGNGLFDDVHSINNKIFVKLNEENRKSFILDVSIDKSKIIDYKYIGFYNDSSIGIVDYDIREELNSYSQLVKDISSSSIVDYENNRINQYKKTITDKFGAHDFKWLLLRFNYYSIGGKILQRRFSNAYNYVCSSFNLASFSNLNHDKLVVYVGLFDIPENNAAGKRVLGNSLIFERLGYTVLLLGCSSQSHILKKYGKNIYYISFPKFKRFSYLKYFSFFKNVLLINNLKPIFIIRYGSPSISLFDLCLSNYCRNNGIINIADVVDWLSPDSNSFIFNIVKCTDTFMEKAIFNRLSDGIISISSYFNNYYKKKHSVVIPPLVSEYVSNSSVNDKINIVYAGVPFRFDGKTKNPNKIKDRIDLVVRYFIKLSNVNKNFILNIYGITKEQFVCAFPEYSICLNDCDNCIAFHGKKSMSFIHDKINDSDFTILLRNKNRSTMYGFPTKVPESFSCGTPVITNVTSDLHKYVVDGVNGFLLDLEDDIVVVNKLNKIISLSKNDIKKMKESVFTNKLFLPENFEHDLCRFIESFNIK